MKRNYKIKLTTAILALMFLSTKTFALHPYKPIDNPPCHGPASAPFDGGISLLIAAGISYASKKGYDKRKKQKDVQNQEK